MKAFIVLSTLLAVAYAGLDFHPDFIRKPFPDGRIVGGTDADIADFAYQVSLQQNGRHICGGAVIAKNWIITAAHCLQGSVTAKMITLRVGSAIHNKGGRVVKAAQFFNHPKFSMNTMYNDVALIRTVEENLLSDYVNTIGLPKVNDSVKNGKAAIISGWGYLKSGEYLTPSNLQYVLVNTVDQQVCKKALALYGGVHETMFCAAAKGKDSCQGDSGGPIVVDGTLVGVVSWGIGCAHPSYPGVYSRLAHPSIRDWVKKISQV